MTHTRSLYEARGCHGACNQQLADKATFTPSVSVYPLSRGNLGFPAKKLSCQTGRLTLQVCSTEGPRGGVHRACRQATDVELAATYDTKKEKMQGKKKVFADRSSCKILSCWTGRLTLGVMRQPLHLFEGYGSHLNTTEASRFAVEVINIHAMCGRVPLFHMAI